MNQPSQSEFETLLPEALAPGRLMQGLGLTARKGLGQNYLTSRAALRQILLALDVTPTDTVVEIGPGLGTLTGYLARHAGPVVAIELDDQLAARLEGLRPRLPDLTLVHADVLTVGPENLGVEVPYKVTGNLPYYITSAALRHVLSWRPTPSLVVVMVQLEVARRVVAAPGDMSLLSLMVQLAGTPNIVARVPAGAFLPKPKVDSAVLRIVPHAQPLVSPAEEEALFILARAAFGQKRKTLANSLTAVWGRDETATRLGNVGIGRTQRPQELSVDQWLSLARTHLQGG